MAKPLPVRVPSDDCPVKSGDNIYFPHEGEWVEMYKGMSVGEAKSMAALARIMDDIRAAEGEPDELIRVATLLERHYDVITAGLAARIVGWNWTDDRGGAMPQPDGTPEHLQQLRAEELMWLLGVSRDGETPTELKNDSRPLAITVSDTPSLETKPKQSTGGRSPKRG